MLSDLIATLHAWPHLKTDPRLSRLQQQALQHPRLYEFLAWLYTQETNGSSVLQQNNLIFPAAFWPAQRNAPPDPDAVLGAFQPAAAFSLPEVFEPPGKLYLHNLRRLSPGLWNGRTYCMDSLEIDDGRPMLTCSSGNFFDALVSCDLLEFELLSAFGEALPEVPAFTEFYRRLILRGTLHAQGNPLHHACGRSAAIGISTLIVFTAEERYHILLRSCGSRLADDASFFHAVPSLMMQPLLADEQQEYSVRHNVYREYLEEVFGVEEGKPPYTPAQYHAVYDDPAIRYLQNCEAAGSARLLLSGVAMDLLKLRPEICVLLLIDDPAWWPAHRRRFRPVTMVDSRHASAADLLDRSPGTPLYAIELSPRLTLPPGLLRPERFTPPGAAALCQGLDLARQLLHADFTDQTDSHK